MARRKGLLKVLGPQAAADAVINAYVSEARGKLGEWAANYQRGISEYLADPQAQNLAKQKLAAWYSALLNIIADIATAYARAKQLYAQSAKQVAPQVVQVVAK